MNGPLALVGGGEWSDGCDFDASLLAASGADEVLLLPTAAAFEHPERAVARAAAWFEDLGASVRGLMVLERNDALDEGAAAVVRAARFVYLGDGSPLHLRSVLKDSPMWQAVLEAWRDGAVVAGTGAGAAALCDPMVDPRGGGLTVGLGLVEGVAVLAGAGPSVTEDHKRTLELVEPGIVLAAVPERTALLRGVDGSWTSAGAGAVRCFVEGREANLDTLPT